MGFFDKLADTAKNLAGSAKAAFDAATAPPPPPELTARQNEITQKFGYGVKGGEKIIFTSEAKDLMATNHSLLLTFPDGSRETVVYKDAVRFYVYFAKNWRYMRFSRRGGDFGTWDNIQLPPRETEQFCQAWYDFYIKGRSKVEHDYIFRRFNGEWGSENASAHLLYVMENFEEGCGFTPHDDERFVFWSMGDHEIVLTDRNLLIDMGYHPDCEADELYSVYSIRNGLFVHFAPKWKEVLFYDGADWEVDIDLFPSEAQDLLIALTENYGGGITHEQFDMVSAGRIALEITLDKNANLSFSELTPL